MFYDTPDVTLLVLTIFKCQKHSYGGGAGSVGMMQVYMTDCDWGQVGGVLR